MALQTDTEQPYRSQLRRLLETHFSLDELRTLCQDIDISFDQLPGENTQSAKSRELITYLKNRGRLDELVLAAVRLRPQVNWPGADGIKQSNPYLGLFAFREDDAHNFFGRDPFAERLATAVAERSFVAVVGASGSGKSSVVFAGLLPRLQTSGGWLSLDFRPKSDPFLELARALTPLLYTDEVDLLTNTRKLATALANSDLPLADIVARILQKQPQAKRLLLTVDQFEELYTLVAETDARQRFLDMLLAANQPNPTLTPNSLLPTLTFTIVLTLRADFLGQALAYRPFADALDKATELLGPMNRAELAQTIEKPAAGQGVAFEAGLVERILDDVGDEPGNLPLLEFALEKLWEQGRDGKLTHVGYEQIGRVQGALAAYADEVYAELNPIEQEQARRGYVQLVKPGAGTEDTRRVATRREVGEENWFLVTQLATARLLVTNQDADGQETVEVVHEALIKRWRRLQEWMTTDRVFREWQERLRAALRGWAVSDHDKEVLLRGAQLGEAQGWFEQRHADLAQDEIAFIELSLAENRQQERRRRLLTIGAGIAAVVFMVLAVLLAITTIDRAEALADSERQRRIAIGQTLAALSALELERSGDAELATLLAIEAMRSSEIDSGSIAWLADDSLRSVLENHFFHNTVTLKHEERVLSVAYSPDGRWLASGSADHMVRIWAIDDEGHPEGEAVVLPGHVASVLSVAYSPDGRWLASGSADLTVRVWALDKESLSRSNPIVLLGHESWVNSVAYSPDGHWLASGSDDQRMRLWELTEDGQPKEGVKPVVLNDGDESVSSVFSRSSSASGSIAYSPDGRRLTSGGDKNNVQLWDLVEAGQPNEEIEPVVLNDSDESVSSVFFNNSSARSVAYSPDGRWLASGNDDQIVRVWPLDKEGHMSGAPVTLYGHRASILSMEYSPNGRWLASGSADGTVRMWPIDEKGQPSSNEPVVLNGHEGWVTSVTYSPRGHLLASGSTDGTVRVWMSPEALVEMGCQLVQRNLSLAEWHLYLGAAPYEQTCPNWPPHPSVP